MHCPPVTTAVIRRPDSKYQLGFCVENGVVSAHGAGSRARPGSGEDCSHPSGRGTHGSGCVRMEEHTASEFLLPASAEVSQKSALQKALCSPPAARVVESVSLMLLSYLLLGWWFLPAFLGVTLVTCCCLRCPRHSLLWAPQWLHLKGREEHFQDPQELMGWVGSGGVARLYAPNSIGDAVTPHTRRSCRCREKLDGSTRVCWVHGGS